MFAQRQEEKILDGEFLEKVEKVRTWFTIVLADLQLFNISPYIILNDRP